MKIENLKSKIVTPPLAESKAVISSFVSSSDAVTKISIDILIPFENQPFKPYTQDKLEELAEDIRVNGIISPVIVRPYENGKYQILAGHNRVRALKLVGLNIVPCIIKNVSEDEARLIVVNTNLNQRQELLPSEKAFAYKMQLESLKHQGVQLEHQQKSIDVLSINSIDSRTQIQRYIRLTLLSTDLLDMVDGRKLAFMVGVNLSFLKLSDQIIVYDYITYENIKINLKQSEKLKELAESNIDTAVLDDIFKKKKSENVEKKYATYKLTSNQKDTLLMCLKSQKGVIEDRIYDELVKLFE